MKTYLYLTRKYIKSYPKRCAGLVLCISLFVFAFLTILWYNNSFQFSVAENSIMKNGLYDSIDFYVDMDLVSENKAQLLDEGAGIVEGLWKLDDENNNIWLGTVDENTSELLPLKLLSGEMPKNEDEVAMEKSTYDALGFSQEIGDTVELTIQKADGSTEKKVFILTGVVKNFSNKILKLNDDKADLSIPSVFTTNNENVTPNYIHVFVKEPSFLTQNIESKYTYYGKGYYEIYQKTYTTKIFLFPMALFFVLATVMGILSISSYFFKEQESYLNLLRCIGFSKKKSKKLLFIQGFLLWASSLVVASILSVLVLLLLKLISSFSSQPLFLDLSWVSLVLAALLEGIIISVSFSILLKRFYKNPPLREAIYTPKKSRRSQTDIKRCWHKAYGRRYRLQNATCIIIVFFCVGMAIFGSFLPLFSERQTSFDNPDEFPDDTDYSLHMFGGSLAAESYYINFPVNSGVSRDAVEKVMKDERVQVLDAYISNLCTPLFLTTQKPQNALLHKYVVEAKEAGRNFLFENERKDEMIQLAGGESGKNCLVELPVVWQSYETAENNIKTFTSGSLNEEKYKSGIEIIAPDSLCAVGDEFTMVIPVPDKDATEENIQEHIKFEVAHVKVGATYSEEEYGESQLIISTEYLFSVHPNVNYEVVLLKNLEPENESWTEELEQDLEYVEAASVGVRYDNYAQMAKEFYDEVNLQTFQIIVSVFIFIIVILIAIICSSYVQVRSNLTSYAIMRAIGARIETIEKLVLNEINHILVKGIVSGAICGWGVIIYFAIMIGNFSKIRTWDIFLFYVAPVFIATVILLYFGSRFATKRAVHSLINKDIIERLNEIE